MQRPHLGRFLGSSDVCVFFVISWADYVCVCLLFFAASLLFDVLVLRSYDRSFVRSFCRSSVRWRAMLVAVFCHLLCFGLTRAPSSDTQSGSLGLPASSPHQKNLFLGFQIGQREFIRGFFPRLAWNK